jgi:RNA polymerase sigma-70 factor (ECF subfamily)
MVVAVADEFEALVVRHQDEVYRYLWRLSGDEQLARDLLQETFLRAYRAFARLDGRGAHRAWLYRIAHNLCLNALSRRRPTASLDGTENTLRGSRGDDPAAIVEGRETLAGVESAIAALPRRQRAALLLRRVQGLDYAEVGAALGCSADTARAHVYQAIRKLRQTLEER